MREIKFSEASKLSFSSAPINFNFNTAIISGACRSGKTTLGNILATCTNVENAEEPWTAKLLPLMSGLGLMDEAVCKEMFLTYITELYNEMILLRRANFRPEDLSCIWAQKDHEEVYSRLTTISTRSEIKEYTKKHSPLLLLNLTEVVPFLKFFFEIMPKTQLIYLMRNGKDVAFDCLNKGWFSDQQLKSPIKALPYQVYRYKDDVWHIPWWVNHGDENTFIRYSEYDRCIYYWCQTIQSGYKSVKELISSGSCYYVNYDNFIQDPHNTINSVSDFIGVKITPMTEMSIAKLQLRKFENHNHAIKNIELKNRFNKISQFEYLKNIKTRDLNE